MHTRVAVAMMMIASLVYPAQCKRKNVQGSTDYLSMGQSGMEKKIKSTQGCDEDYCLPENVCNHNADAFGHISARLRRNETSRCGGCYDPCRPQCKAKWCVANRVAICKPEKEHIPGRYIFNAWNKEYALTCGGCHGDDKKVLCDNKCDVDFCEEKKYDVCTMPNFFYSLDKETNLRCGGCRTLCKPRCDKSWCESMKDKICVKQDWERTIAVSPFYEGLINTKWGKRGLQAQLECGTCDGLCDNKNETQ